jgi:hypothetical protein
MQRQLNASVSECIKASLITGDEVQMQNEDGKQKSARHNAFFVAHKL